MIAGYLLLAVLIATANAVPLRLEEELLLRDIMRRGSNIGCDSDDGEVLFLLDGTDSGFFSADAAAAAESARFLSPKVTIEAAVYGSAVGSLQTFDFGSASSELASGLSATGGSTRNAAAAIKFATENMNSQGKKIAVLFVDGPLDDAAEAEEEAKKAFEEGIEVYVVMPSSEFKTLESSVSNLATKHEDSDYTLLQNKGGHIAESFQLDLNVKYNC